jgi:predicted protein tyrosine phosphatase
MFDAIPRVEDNGDIASEIIPGLYIGNMNSAKNKHFFINKRIKAVVNLTPSVSNYFAHPSSDVEYLRINVNDSLQQNDIKKMFYYFPAIVEFVQKNLVLDGKSVLVHCHAGVQRSAAAVTAYLMRYHKLPLSKAMSKVRQNRPMTFNYGRSINFKHALVTYHAQLFGKSAF